MKIFILGLVIGIVFGIIGGMLTEGQFHPDIFVLVTILSCLVILLIEIQRSKKKVDKINETKKAS